MSRWELVKFASALAVLFSAVACSTIHRAREAQAEACAAVSARQQREVVAEDSLVGLMDIALTNRPEMVAARLAVEDARLALKEIAADAPLISETPWNAFGLSASASRTASESGRKISDIGFSNGDSSAALSLDLLVYDFGRNAASARQQAERIVAAEETLLKEGCTIVYEVASAFFTCIERDGLLAAAEASADSCRIALEQVERRAEEGEAKPLDVQRAKLDLAQATESCVASSNEFISASTELSRAVGVPVKLSRPKGELVAMSIVDDAEDFSPAVRIARARVKAASAAVDRAVAELYPEVSASTSFSWTDPLWVFRWGVSATESLFTGFRRTTQVDRAVVALKSAQAELASTVLDFHRDLDLAVAERKSAAEALAAAEKSLKTAEDNQVLVEAQFKVGEADRVDMSTAIRDFYAARASKLSAIARAQRIEAKLFMIFGICPYSGDERKSGYGN